MIKTPERNDVIKPAEYERPAGAFCIEVAPGPCVLVLFGGTGDLARRKLLPSLFQLHRLGLLHAATRIVGCGRSLMTDAAFREKSAAFLPQAEPPARAAFMSRVTYLQADADEPSTFHDLAAHLDGLDRTAESPVPLNRLYYLAVPPSSCRPIISLLDKTGQISEHDHDRGPWRHLLLEKPFGADTATAAGLDAFLKTVAKEEQLFRIDHYLGKETIQNIIITRFANIIFEPLWNARYVDHVQITVAETLGVEGRANYFDHTGLLRDMFQNHMIEMLALTAMEPPERFDADDIHDRKLHLIRAIRPLALGGDSNAIVRAQYGAGQGGPAYREEPGVAAQSATETFVAARLWIDTPRWAGTPFYLRAGKRLAANSSTITIVFKPSPHFNPGGLGANALVLRSRPDEGMRLHLLGKNPGPKLCVGTLPLSFDYDELTSDNETPDAYARLLLDAMLHDHTLFVRSPSIRTAWELFTPVLDLWRDRPDQAPLHTYEAGAAGPVAADELLAADGRTWFPL